MKKLLVLLALGLLSAPVTCGEPPPTSNVVRLVTGESVRVYSVIRYTFGDNSHPPSLLLRYETSLPTTDSPALRKEVMKVWALLQPMADASSDTYAMVMANEPIRGVVSQTKHFVYGFERDVGGAWRMREPRKRSR